MLKKLPALLMHLAMLALVCAIGAYWVLKIVTPAPGAAPPPMAGQAPREADPTLAARMFGQVQAAPIVASNVQVLGVFSAGKDSSAVVSVDGKPGRVVLLGQSVAPGSQLAEVRRDGITLDNNGVRQELKLPPRPPVAMGGPPAPAAFTRDGNTLTAPTAGAPAAPPAPAQAPGFPGFGPAPGFATPQGVPPRPMPQPLQPQPDPHMLPQGGAQPGLPSQ